MEQLIFVTGNEGKAREAMHVLGTAVKRMKLDLDEIQSLDLRTVVEHKVRQAYAKLGQAVIAEDVSLEIAQLGGLPATFIKWFEQALHASGIAKLVRGKNRSARYAVGYGFFDGKTFFYAEGVLQGTIATKPRGSFGFGFDPIFIPQGYTKTIGELGFDVKVKIGPRTKALLKLKKILDSGE